MNWQLLLFLMIASFLRLFLANFFPLTADESYYWLWSKHLSLSYVDHPPMVAIINFLTTLGHENLFALRLGCVVITLLVTVIIYFLAKTLFNEKVAFWSAVIFQLIPHFVVVWLTMFVELPLALFWSLSLLILAKIFRKQIADSRTQNTGYWLLLGITIGLGTLSKYTMFLFWPCLGLFFLLSPENRFWLRRKEPYLCLLLSLILFLPVLVWNSQHAWVSFTFHSGKATASIWGTNVLPLIGDQLVHFTPFLIFALFPVFKNVFKTGNRDVQSQVSNKLLFAFSFPILVLFLILSLKIKVWAHWPSIGYIAAIPLTVAYLVENGKNLKKFITWIACFSLLVLSILLFLSPGILLHQRDYARNYQLAQKLPQDLKIFAKTNVSASLLEFYAKRQTYLATGFFESGHPWGEKQYELWGIPNLNRGESVLYYGEDSDSFRQLVTKHFSKITEIPDARLYLIEDYITNNYKMFKLEGFRNAGFHP